MRSISDTLSRLAASKVMGASAAAGTGDDRLSDLGAFGSNCGALKARVYIPSDLPRGAPLVVVLHGCTQTAAGYDRGSGWSRLADRHGFAVLFPEQQRANNANLCFNWFVPGDIRRGGGEALSIRQMVARMVEAHGIDPKRIFITGLSAGGAMTSVMLATYPEVFAGGAIIAGLPYGVAASLPQALDAMRGHGQASDSRLAGLVRKASKHVGPWPTLSVWHGDADHTVAASNADAVLGQWRTLHGVAETPTRTDRIAGHRHRVWCDAGGRVLIEDYRIAGMGHGTPLNASAPGSDEIAGPHMLDVGLSSTLQVAASWGLVSSAAVETVGVKQSVSPDLLPGRPSSQRGSGRPAPRHAAARPSGSPTGGVGKIIEDALRAAGLMR
jgi:poly(hydroxyalkanoate) depolymerase family esterase